jgi:hypothetical protein
MGAPQQFPAVEDVFPHFAHLYCAIASHLLSSDRVVQRHRRRSSFTSQTNDPTAPSLPFRAISSAPVARLYLVKVSSFLTDLTPGTPRAISEALALEPMVGTSPVRVTTPASVRTSNFLSCHPCQYVGGFLALPFRLRYLLAWDHGLQPSGARGALRPRRSAT